MRLEIEFYQSYPILNHDYRQLIPKIPRPLEKNKPRKHWKPQIWGKNPRFGTTGQIILKVP